MKETKRDAKPEIVMTKEEIIKKLEEIMPHVASQTADDIATIVADIEDDVWD